MKKYMPRDTKWLAICTLVGAVMLITGVALTLIQDSLLSIVLALCGGIMSILSLCVFLATKSRVLIIDTEKIIFPRGAKKNGKLVLQKTVIKPEDIRSVESNLYTGDGVISKDCLFYTLTLKDGTKVTVTLYEYGKDAEKEILDTIQKSIV